MSNLKQTRRSFLESGSMALAGLALTNTATSAQAQDASRPPVCLFSKHVQFLDYKTMATTLAEMGFDGIDLTVRSGGHVLPDRVRDDLPKAVEAAEAAGLTVHQITTRIMDRDSDHAEAILETASQLGIRYYRFGSYQYDYDRDMFEQLKEWQDKLKALAGMNAHYNMIGGYHNHSGGRNIGAALWDLDWMLEGVAPEWVGSNYDIGHAIAEGSKSAWIANFNLIAPHIKMSSIKDFAWSKDGEGRWRSSHPAVGEGIVPWNAVLTRMKNIGFSGPFSIHIEYGIPGDTEEEHNRNLLAAVRTDLATLRGYMDKVW